MKQKYKILSGIIAAFFISLSVWAWFKPQQDISLSERRRLAKAPELKLEKVLSGKFMRDFEAYAADQFPDRDEFRRLKSIFSQKVLGRSDINDLYIENGWAVKMEYPLNEAKVKRAGERFRYVYDKYLKDNGGKSYICLIPDKNFYAAGDSHMKIDYEAMRELLLQSADFGEYIDIWQLLSLEDYYKTDSHWSQERLLAVAEKIASEMGTGIDRDFTENKIDREFMGVYAGQLPLPMEADEIKYLSNECTQNALVHDFQNGRDIPLYDLEKAMGADGYEMFAGGPLSLVSMENPLCHNGKRLIIFRDSFASSLAPLLLSGYEELVLVDIRYIHPDLIGKYVDFSGADALFLYNTAVINNSETIK